MTLLSYSARWLSLCAFLIAASAGNVKGAVLAVVAWGCACRAARIEGEP